jgi:hypothetical protein
VLGECIRTYYKNPRLEWAPLVGLLLSKFEEHPEFKTFKLDSLSRLKVELVALDLNNRSLSAILSAFYLNYKTIHQLGGSRWGDKTPLNTFHLEELAGVFPSSQYVHIIRDPFDAISSYVKAGIYNDFESAAKRWLFAVEESCRFGREHPSQYFEVMYRDLVTNPVSTVRGVCEFLGVEYVPELLGTPSIDLGDVGMHAHHANVQKAITPDSLGKGRKSLTSEEYLSIIQVLETSSEPLVISFLS